PLTETGAEGGLAGFVVAFVVLLGCAGAPVPAEAGAESTTGRSRTLKPLRIARYGREIQPNAPVSAAPWTQGSNLLRPSSLMALPFGTSATTAPLRVGVARMRSNDVATVASGTPSA